MAAIPGKIGPTGEIPAKLNLAEYQVTDATARTGLGSAMAAMRDLEVTRAAMKGAVTTDGGRPMQTATRVTELAAGAEQKAR